VVLTALFLFSFFLFKVSDEWVSNACEQTAHRKVYETAVMVTYYAGDGYYGDAYLTNDHFKFQAFTPLK